MKTPIIAVAIPLTNQQLMVEAARNGRNMALNCLAAAAERKNNISYEQNMSQYYTKHPNSAEAVAFFTAMGRRYKDKQQEQALAKSVQYLSNTAVVSPPVLGVEEVADESIEPKEEDDKEEMPGTLPSTQVMMVKMSVMAKKNKASNAGNDINDSQETMWEDSTKPNAVLRYGLLDYVPLAACTSGNANLWFIHLNVINLYIIVCSPEFLYRICIFYIIMQMHIVG